MSLKDSPSIRLFVPPVPDYANARAAERDTLTGTKKAATTGMSRQLKKGVVAFVALGCFAVSTWHSDSSAPRAADTAPWIAGEPDWAVILGPKELKGKKRRRPHCLTRDGCHTDLSSAQPVSSATQPSWLLSRLLAPSCLKLVKWSIPAGRAVAHHTGHLLANTANVLVASRTADGTRLGWCRPAGAPPGAKATEHVALLSLEDGAANASCLGSRDFSVLSSVVEDSLRGLEALVDGKSAARPGAWVAEQVRHGRHGCACVHGCAASRGVEPGARPSGRLARCSRGGSVASSSGPRGGSWARCCAC